MLCLVMVRLQVSNMENSNPRKELEKIKNKVLEQLSQLPPVPSVPLVVMPATTKVGRLRQPVQAVAALVPATRDAHMRAVSGAVVAWQPQCTSGVLVLPGTCMFAHRGMCYAEC